MDNRKNYCVELSLHIWTSSNTSFAAKPQSRADPWHRTPPLSGGSPPHIYFHILHGYVSEVACKAAGAETGSKFNNIQLYMLADKLG